MPRSASTWSFNVVLTLLRSSQPTPEVHGGYDENIERFLKSVPSTATHAIVKCHSLDACGRALATSDRAKVIYTWRDPADVAVSCMRMFGYDFEGSLAAVDSSLELYDFHHRSGSALILDYEQIVSASIDAVRRIAVFLGLDDDSNTVRRIAEQTSLKRVRQDSESLTDSARLAHHSDLEYDPQTLLHRKHVRDGSMGYGRKLLTAEQTGQIDALLQKHDLAQR